MPTARVAKGVVRWASILLGLDLVLDLDGPFSGGQHKP